MRGRSQKSRILFFLLALCFLLLQGWKTPAPFVDLTYFELTFFVRTNAAGGFVVTRGFDAQGPLDKQRFFTGVRLVQSGVDNEWLGIEGNNVIRVEANGEATVETGPADLNNSPAALTYDSTRSRSLAATIAGQGFLFQRPQNQPWSLLSGMDNVHLVAMAYFHGDDVIWALRQYENAPTAPAIFTKYSPEGIKLEDFTTNGFPVNIGPGEFAAEMIRTEGPAGASYLLIAKPSTAALTPGDISRIYAFDPGKGSFYLTAEKIYAPEPPSVQFTFPNSEDEILIAGAPFSLSLTAFDIDGDLQTVELLDNGSAFKVWTFEPPSYATTNQLDTSWTPFTDGSHTITARARDARGTTTETSVTVEVVQVKTERSLPAAVFAGQTIPVQLTVTPASGTPSWTLKEKPPADWTILPGTEGTLEPVSHEITWGPFTDSAQRTFIYFLTPSASCTLSNFDGHALVNGISVATVGPSSIHLTPPSMPAIRFVSFDNSQTQIPPGAQFPISFEVSDADGDLRAVELRADGTLLNQWTFNPVWFPSTNWLQTNWTTDSDGHHIFSVRAEDSLGKVTEKSSTLDVTIVTGISVSRNLPTNVIAGQSFTVSLLASPSVNAHSWTIKEQPPAGWKVTVGADASFNPDTHEISWGPFADPQIQRTLTYDTAAPVAGASATFSGRVFVDGASELIFGRTTTYVLPATETSVRWIDAQHVIINFNAFPGVTFVLESSDSVNSTTWTPVRTVLGGDIPIQVGPIEIPNQQLFYRLRPAF